MPTSVSLQEFTARHLPALEQDQARHNLMLGLLSRAAKDPGKARFWSLGEGAGCALQTPPHYLVLGDLSALQCMALAAEVQSLDFSGCIGSGAVPEAMTHALAAHGKQLRLGMPQRIYTLNREPLFPKAEGKGRRATLEDKELYLDWMLALMKEAVPHDPPQDRKMLEEKALDRPVFFWEWNGKPAAMASRSRETKDGSNISLVYTPPEFRGRGFGGSATAFACQDVFREGKRLAFLYTDLRNPVSNKIYQKIGFEPWCEASTWIKP